MLKKLTPPTEEMPEAYKNIVLESNSKPEVKQQEFEVPPKVIFNYNLKKLASFKKIRQNYKIKNLKNAFLYDLKTVLKEYNPANPENELNDELLIQILNIAEEYFFTPKSKDERETLKHECVLELMLPYFRNDEKLLEKTIANVFHKVKKSTVLKRVYQRFKFFFVRD